MKAEVLPVVYRALVGKGIAEFIPKGFDVRKTPSLILEKEPKSVGQIPDTWSVCPEFFKVNDKTSVHIPIKGKVSLYGGGEVTGPLLRNGQFVKMWNTDTGAYKVDNGKRLYQTHPWVLCVREDGSAFGILFDTTWKAVLHTDADQVVFDTEGNSFRVFIIDRKTPQDVLRGLSELIGTIPMPPRWSLGYHQCRFTYTPDQRVREIADTFRLKNIPCDAIWMDIDYMDGYRIFTFNPTTFSNPVALNKYLHQHGFHSVYMIDCGVKVDSSYFVYQSGLDHQVFMKNPDGSEYHGKVWPGACAFPDFTMPSARKWWAGLYKDFMAKGVDGVWNDMDEPAINDSDLPVGKRLGTMPYSLIHSGGGQLPSGPHLLYHNAYGRLEVEATYKGILKALPQKRPFVLTRANLLGGQRYAATWTGDNFASDEYMKLSVPMSLTLGLSGQPFSGPDIGGFLGNTSPDLWADWIGFGAFFPFCRGHACAGTNAKEPWAFGKEIENTSRIALDRRYRLLPYLYTLFNESHRDGLPVMRPVFFADLKDPLLRNEQEAFLLGSDLLVIPRFSRNPHLPSGIWETLHLIDGEELDQHQAILKIRGGSIIPLGRVIQDTEESSFSPLTLAVCLDRHETAEGDLYLDSGDGWSFQKGDYSLLHFTARRKGRWIRIHIGLKDGKRKALKDIHGMVIYLTSDGKEIRCSGPMKRNFRVAF